MTTAVGMSSSPLVLGCASEGAGLDGPEAVLVQQCLDRFGRKVRGRRRGRGRHVGKELHPRVEEIRPLTPGEMHRVSLLVHQSVVEPAEQDQVLQLRLASVGPVPDVVGVREAKPAARETASTVPGLQGAPDGGWNRPGLTPDVEC